MAAAAKDNKQGDIKTKLPGLRLRIVFQTPDELGFFNDGYQESRSKILEPSSRLCALAATVRGILDKCDCKMLPHRDLHIQLTTTAEDILAVAAKVHKLCTVNVADLANWNWCGKAFVLTMPFTQEHTEEKAHLTICAFAPDTQPPSIDFMRGVVFAALTQVAATIKKHKGVKVDILMGEAIE